MTSLRTICTSLKKSSFLFLFIFALLSDLSGASFRIAIISEDKAYQRLLEDVLLSFGPVSTDYAFHQVEARESIENEIEYLSQLDKYIKAENFDAIGKLGKKNFDKENLELSLNFPELSAVEHEYLLGSDPEAISYIKLRDGYDMLLTVTCEDIDSLPLIRFFQDGTMIRESLFSSDLKSDEEAFLFDHFSKYFLSEGQKLISLDFPANGTLYIDDEIVSHDTSKIVMEKGSHSVFYIVPGYVSKKFKIEISDDTKFLDLNLELMDPASMNISSIPYDASIFYNGSLLDGKYIGNLEYPFTISAKADGFSLYSMQSLKPVESLSIVLKPKWMQEENLLEQSKNEFYMNLFSTLLCFGTYIASETVDNLLPNYNIKPVSVVLGGISLVSLINMVDSMFEYFDSANYGI